MKKLIFFLPLLLAFSAFAQLHKTSIQEFEQKFREFRYELFAEL